jgi:hypothetical protein
VRNASAQIAGLAAVVAISCTSDPSGQTAGITPQKHLWFPITAGLNHELGRMALDGVVACASCHAESNTSYKQFECVGCHEHPKDITDRLHLSVTDYRYAGEGCYQCHPDGSRHSYDHAGVDSMCASCHDMGKLFAALPMAGFTHPSMGGSDCGGCHVKTTWLGAGMAPLDAHDPNQDVATNPLVPTWSGTTIVSVSQTSQSLPMRMNHASGAIPTAANSACTNCHADADVGNYYPGQFHLSLLTLMLPQPSGCTDCHAYGAATPSGFVGAPATMPVRTPQTGEMRHDAVLWSSGTITAAAMVKDDCGVCHTAPWAGGAADWSTGAAYHSALTTAGKAQPTQCLDCHANTRPAAVLTSANAALPQSLSFDHGQVAALGECITCHTKTAPTQFQSWTGGKFHLTGGSAPASCLPCHVGERPTSTSGWTSATYSSRPFDYVTNAKGIAHGDGLDCVTCHSRTQDWSGGNFVHGAMTASGTTCVACHSTQRPSAPVMGFDHLTSGTGDCFGCHQATVMAGTYNALADWQGGQQYPGPTLISSSDQFIIVSSLQLNRSGPNNLVTSTTTTQVTLYNAMLHTSAVLRPELNAGPPPGDQTKCWHCHTSMSGTTSVISFLNGQFHPSLAAYQDTPDAGAQDLGQPTSRCADCHSNMWPPNIVQSMGSDLQPMDHSATFKTTVSIGGAMVTKVSQLDCSTCHNVAAAGMSWSGGVFHAKIGATAQAQLSDCTMCHYPLMADAAKADVTQATDYKMSHRSLQLTFQSCQTCHTGALTRAGMTPIAVPLWRSSSAPAGYHLNLSSQPAACVDCHTVSLPANATAGTELYAPLNQNQWMSHASNLVVGKDCAVCHAADAKTSGSAWNKASKLHGPISNAATCRECHGLTNGNGTTPGANNNMPSGLIDSSTVTSASAATGIAAGTHDQISHADVNVTGRDCNFCHTQQGTSTAAGVQGHEWAAAKFHVNFTGAYGLVLDGASGRCSNCHLNVKPAATFTGFDHSGFTSASGTQDCSSCHAWPGTGTAAVPNWLGATGAPATVTLAPWSSGTSVTSNTVTFDHPPASTYASCAQCHPGVNYGVLIDFNHAGITSNVTINGAPVSPQPNLGTSVYNATGNATFCVYCHNTSSPYVTTAAAAPFIGNTTAGSTTVSTGSTAALTQGMTITGSPIPTNTSTTTNFVGSTTAGSTSVNTATPVSLSSGTVISGPGIPANDAVATSVNNATTFTLRVAATATGSSVALTGVRTQALTVTIRSVTNATSFVISSPASTTAAGATLSVTHKRPSQARIGNHNGSVSGQDCTSCHARGGSQGSSPPTSGVFSTGSL